MKNKFLQNYVQRFDATAKVNQQPHNLPQTAINVQVQTYTPQQTYVSSNSLQIEQEKLAAELESLRINKERIARERKIEEELSAKIDLEKKDLRLEQEKLNEEQKKLFEFKLVNNQKSHIFYQNEIKALKESLISEKETIQLEMQRFLRNCEYFKLHQKKIMDYYEKFIMPSIEDNKKALNEIIRENQERLRLQKEKISSEKELILLEQAQIDKGQDFIQKEFEKLDNIISCFLSTTSNLNLEETYLLGDYSTSSND